MKLIKQLLVAMLITLSLSAQADIDTALQNFRSENYLQAFQEYKQLANRGNIQAQYSLGGYYQYAWGNVVSPNLKEAIKWYRLASSQWLDGGHWSACAMQELSQMYQNGEGGLPKSYVVFYAIKTVISVATDSDVLHDRIVSKKELSYIEQKMSQSQIEEGKLLSNRLMKRGNFLATLDAYSNNI